MGSGGTESYLSKLANFLFERNYEVTIITLDSSEPMYHLCKGINLHQCEFKSKPLASLKKLLKLSKNENPNIIFSWLTISNFIALCFLSRLRICPLFCCVRQGKIILSSASWVSNWLAILNLFIYRKANMVIFNNQAAITNHTFKYIPAFNFKVIQNGLPTIDGDSLHSNKKTYGHGKLVKVGFVARNDPIKNFNLFLDIVGQLKIRSYSIEAHIYGSGYQNKRDEKGSKQTKNVVFHGFIKDKSIIYNNIDVLFLTSFSEGMPNNVLEALSENTWVIAHNIGGLRDIEHPKLLKIPQLSASEFVDIYINYFLNDKRMFDDNKGLQTEAQSFDEFKNTIQQNCQAK